MCFLIFTIYLASLQLFQHKFQLQMSTLKINTQIFVFTTAKVFFFTPSISEIIVVVHVYCTIESSFTNALVFVIVELSSASAVSSAQVLAFPCSCYHQLRTVVIMIHIVDCKIFKVISMMNKLF